MKNIKSISISIVTILVITFASTFIDEVINNYYAKQISSFNISEIPSYDGHNYVYINENKPDFDDSEYNYQSFERYSELDLFGRAGVAYANIDISLMPTEPRGSIGVIKPTGWHTVKYDIVDGKYLYNRCHLIGYQLTGENANEKNLITCTRQMNTIGMLEFENQVADYIRKTNDNVLYKVTPIYEGTNLIAKGVQIEAASVSDKCGKICFNVFVYNVQDGIYIDYKTGDSSLKK